MNSSLNAKIQEAASLFQTHDFKKSLQIYDQCISMCKKNNQSKSLLQNLMSSKGALMSILGDQKGALQCVNQVLDINPYHSLCLLRRSQIYKKTNKLNKALKDLKALLSYSPDNLQLAALKVQIQNLKLKSKQTNSQSESQSQKSNESIDLDEEQQLNFSNLKCIDRKSCSIMFPGNGARKSRVTIAGDIAIQYQAIEYDNNDDDKSFASTNASKQYLKEKYVKTFKEICLDDEQEQKETKKEEQIPVLKIKTSTAGRTKSILKNRESTLYIDTNLKVQKQKKYGGRQSKMIDLLKNIDGKPIEGTNSEKGSNLRTSKEVQFRKSIFGGFKQEAPTILGSESLPQKTNKPIARKSCLKRSSFESVKIQAPTNQPRKSKLERVSKVGIDGAVIKSNRKDFSESPNKKNDSDSDEGSEHNIFGSRQIVISKQVRQTLGIGDGNIQEKKQGNSKPRVAGGKSILKKSSVLHKSIDKGSLNQGQKNQPVKAKKSVMFSRFNNKQQNQKNE